MASSVPEDVYKAQLDQYPGPWAFQLGKQGIILVSDQELRALADPDKVLNLTLTFEKQEASLRQICERARAAGQRTLIIAFDQFFTQYRPGQAGPRELMPDMDEYIERIAGISRFAQQYGLGLELSLLSPLEIGKAYAKATGESGVWMQYRKGLRDPKTGAYSVQLWRHEVWTNNKGPFPVDPAGVRVFAFRETPIRGTSYRVVDPNQIVEISETAQVEELGASEGGMPMRRIRVYGTGRTELGPLTRVLVVQQYRTPEMDYFSPRALPYLKALIDKYADAGVKLNALYSDEMHIQQDWSYFGHHDHGQFTLRYVSPGLEKRYAELYGAQYRDFARYLLYFCYGQEDFASDLSATEGVQHVFGASPEDIRRTALFRSRYYKLLQDGVVDLFVAAKRHAEVRMGHRLESRAHATWAESPTIDYWRTGPEPMYQQSYEYTSNFVWSDTVHQAAAACADYFKWGDFLTGNGNDHAECGWLDRNYVGLALACSTGIINDVPYSYAAHWGMPDAASARRMALVDTYGCSGSPLYNMVQDMQHRDCEVLALYPLDLVAVEERFGSWMTQYGYWNQITAAKLLEKGRLEGGAIVLGGRRFTTLVAQFEPFPSKRLLDLMRRFVEAGGRLVWSGPPPVVTEEGESALDTWRTLFGVDYTPLQNDGLPAPGKTVVFEGALKSVPPQAILTDFLPDRIYPAAARPGTHIVARVKEHIVGTQRVLPGGGTATYLGFRPRDDQSRSLGVEIRTWFETLRALGAYPSTGKWKAFNDNTEVVSRTTPYLTCRFPNGAIAIAPHFCETEEGWNGGFARDRKADEAYLKAHPLPSDALDLKDFRVNGRRVTYKGTHAVTFRADRSGRLLAFAGSQCSEITIDGRRTVFADKPIGQLAWAPIQDARKVPGGAVLQIMVYGTGTIRIPAHHLPGKLLVVAEGPTPGSRGEPVASSLRDGVLNVTVDAKSQGRWLYAVPE